MYVITRKPNIFVKRCLINKVVRDYLTIASKVHTFLKYRHVNSHVDFSYIRVLFSAVLFDWYQFRCYITKSSIEQNGCAVAWRLQRKMLRFSVLRKCTSQNRCTLYKSTRVRLPSKPRKAAGVCKKQSH